MSTRESRKDAVACVTIAGREIGPGRRVLTVAEAGVNHNGEVATALRREGA